MTNEEINYIVDAIDQLVKNHQQWKKDYVFDGHSNTFTHIHQHTFAKDKVEDWFGTTF